MHPTLQAFATLDIDHMSDKDKASFITQSAAALGMEPNKLVNAFRDMRAVSLSLTHVQSMDLENSVTSALVRVALFNARRCYHSLLSAR